MGLAASSPLPCSCIHHQFLRYYGMNLLDLLSMAVTENEERHFGDAMTTRRDLFRKKKRNVSQTTTPPSAPWMRPTPFSFTEGARRHLTSFFVA